MKRFVEVWREAGENMIVTGFFRKLYYAFVYDTIRTYRAIPGRLRRVFWVIFALQAVQALAEAAFLFVLTFFGMSMALPDVTKENFIVRRVFSLFPSMAEYCSDNRRYVFVISLAVIAFIVFKNLVASMATLKTMYFTEDISLHVGMESMRRYLSRDYFWHLSPGSSDILHRMGLRAHLSHMLVNLLLLYSYVLSSCTLFLVLAMAEPFLTSLVVVVFFCVGMNSYLALRRRLDIAGKASGQSSVGESKAMHAAVNGIREVLIYRQQDVFLKSVSDAATAGKRPRAFLNLSAMIPSWLLEISGFATVAGVLAIMILSDADMPRIVQAASMLMLAAWRVLPAVSRVLSLSVAIRGSRSMAVSCLELLEKFKADKYEPLPDPDPGFRFERSLSLENADFRYPSAHGDSLKGLSLEIFKGERVGFIGLSGAGKSTLALILSGLLPLRKGTFSVDGAELSPAGRAAYAMRIGFVPQAPFLIGGTVADNVAFSRWGLDYDRAEVERACRQAAMDFVFDHPKGVDIPIGSGGSGVSGGQAQRISIARALFTNPEIVIFDEATSALDQASENTIIDAIERLGANATVVIIAHRLTTVEKCDRVFWMDKGKIIASGTPDEIIPEYVKFMNDSTESSKTPAAN